jgi:NCAIR mutase (PurE)-related protein
VQGEAGANFLRPPGGRQAQGNVAAGKVARMDEQALWAVLEQFRAGRLEREEVCARVRDCLTGDLGFARLDHQRPLRCGLPEVVYGAGKTVAQIQAILADFAARGRNALVTRLRDEDAAPLLAAFPAARHDAASRTLVLTVAPTVPRPGRVAVVSAGTSDLPVASEAVVTLTYLGYTPDLVQDVGVAGLHRLLAQQERLRAAQVVIVVAGMEGALPSVVAGLVAAPVIAVPTSIGYGAHLGGLTPLLAMITSCASGITVVNIDNGFGAACAAARVLAQLVPQPSAQGAPR